MHTIELPDRLNYYNLFTQTGIPQNKSLVVRNNSSYTLKLIQSNSQPAVDSTDWFPVVPGEQVYVHRSTRDGTPIWAAGSTGALVIEGVEDATVSDYSTVFFPKDMVTFPEEGYRRLRVDVAQTSFFLGQQFRSYMNFSLANGEIKYLRLNSSVDFILFDLKMLLHEGEAELSTWVGATPSGVWDVQIPTHAKNRMESIRQPPYSSQVVLETGAAATFSGGTQTDSLRIKVSSSTAQAQTVGGSLGDERGLPADTYYLRLQNLHTGTTVGTISGFWEERPLPTIG